MLDLQGLLLDLQGLLLDLQGLLLDLQGLLLDLKLGLKFWYRAAADSRLSAEFVEIAKQSIERYEDTAPEFAEFNKRMS